jgi:hypothetical protein
LLNGANPLLNGANPRCKISDLKLHVLLHVYPLMNSLTLSHSRRGQHRGRSMRGHYSGAVPDFGTQC